MSAMIDSSAKQVSAGRARLVILFSDLCGSTRLGGAMEAEDFGALLADVREICRVAVNRHGGLVVRAQGDGVLAVFGHPRPQETDGRSAAEAALEIHERVAALAPEALLSEFHPLAMHSGIHAGILLLAAGDIERGRMDVIGDAANTAAHLSKLAGRGEILASRDALGPYRYFFDVATAHSLSLGGSPHATEVLTLRARNEAQRRTEAASAAEGRSPFVGRSATLATVIERLRKGTAAPGANRCLVLVGEPGVGKTRFLGELIQALQQQDIPVYSGHCESHAGAQVLQPFRQIAAELQLADTTSADDAAPNIADEGIARITTVIEAAAQAGPLILPLDDWQWADDASLQLGQRLMQAGPAGLKLVLACRPHPQGSAWVAGADEITIGPLSEEETAATVARWLPDADPLLVERIHRYSGGLPLYIEELCHSIRAGGTASAAALEQAGSGQRWLASVVAARVHQLAPEQATLLRKAAVLGNEFPVWLLHRLAGDGAQGEPDVAPLVEQHFLLGPDRNGLMRFCHGITRDAIYDTISAPQRRALHLAVFDILRQHGGSAADDAGALAFHANAAASWAQAAEYAEIAGDRALAAHALDRARIQYRTAMRALQKLPDQDASITRRWCLLAHKFGFASLFDPLALDDGLTVFRQCVEKAEELGDPDLLARSEYWLGYQCYTQGYARDGVRHAETALRLAQAGPDRRLEAQIQATLGQALSACSDYDRALALIDGALATQRTPQGESRHMPPIGAAYSLACKGIMLADRGQFDDAHGCFDESLHLLDNSAHPIGNPVRIWIATAHIWQGQWELAARVAQDSRAIGENTRMLMLLALSSSVAAYVDWIEGKDPNALARMEEGLRWMTMRGNPSYSSLHSGWLVEATSAAGDRHAMRAHAVTVFRRARVDDRMGEAHACRALALHAGGLGNSARAIRYLTWAQRSAQVRQSRRETALNDLCAARLALLQNRPADARAPLERATADFERMRMAWHLQQAMDLMSTPEPV